MGENTGMYVAMYVTKHEDFEPVSNKASSSAAEFLHHDGFATSAKPRQHRNRV
jgi:hypothetical protein